MEINRIETNNELNTIQNNIDKEDQELIDVCKDFESIFISMILKNARDSIPESDLIEKSFGTEVFEDMYIDEISKEVANQGDLGLGKMLYEQFTKGYVSL